MAVTGPPLIEARGLCVRFGKVAALDGLDLVARPGQVLAILGPNGAGKTTFVRTVATLVPPSGGELRVRGIDVGRDPVAVRREIGLAGQFAAVEPAMTGRENLGMVARLFGHRRKAAEAAAAAVIEMLGLGEVADRRAGTYSGGQRRRLDLGASLVGAPRLLLLDEPTTGLDPAGRAEVWAAVRSLVAGRHRRRAHHALPRRGRRTRRPGRGHRPWQGDRGRAPRPSSRPASAATSSRSPSPTAGSSAPRPPSWRRVTASPAVIDRTGQRVRGQAGDGATRSWRRPSRPWTAPRIAGRRDRPAPTPPSTKSS